MPNIYEFAFPVISESTHFLYHGTCFVAKNEDRIYLVTVKHVITDKKGSIKTISPSLPENKHFQTKPLTMPGNYDIGFITLDEKTITKWGMKPITLMNREFSAGFDFLTACYPLSLTGVQHSNQSYSTAMIFKGYISCSPIDHDNSTFSRNYFVSGFHMHQGVSGAPMFFIEKGEAFCIGMLFGSQVTTTYHHIGIDEHGKDQNEKETNYFGMGVSSKEIIEILNCSK